VEVECLRIKKELPLLRACFPLLANAGNPVMSPHAARERHRHPSH